MCDLIAEQLKRINARIPAQQRIRRFILLHKEFDADDLELTRTKKLRRSWVEQHYSRLIDALYSENPQYFAEADVKYRDGRTAKLQTALKILSVEQTES